MTNSCVVPTCDTGRKAIKEKRSTFKAPADIELRNKWTAAIPGIVQLMPWQFVCEKHFLQCYIRRKWTKYDNNGRIIAEVPYARVSLDPSAVPTVFDNPSQAQNVTIALDVPTQKYVSLEHSYCSPDKFAATEANDTSITTETSSPINLKKHPAMDQSSDQKIPDQDSLTEHVPLARQNSRTDFPVESVNPAQDIATNGIRTLNDAIVESPKSHGVGDECSPTKPSCYFHISEVRFSCITEATVESISIPKRWTVCEQNTNKRSFLFSYYVSKIEKEDNLPVMERNVKLNFNKELRYYVYGRPVDITDWSLPQVLDDVRSLPRVLEKFKNSSLCNGLGVINDHHLGPDNAFKDYVNRWHHVNCTLISKSKRCADCIRLRTMVVKREARSKKNASRQLYRTISPIDQSKLIALSKKIANLRRWNNRAQKRITLLKSHKSV